MAIDAVEKRVSVPGVGRPFMRATWPDASKPESWRQSVGLIYNGNTFVSTIIPVGILCLDSISIQVARATTSITVAESVLSITVPTADITADHCSQG